MSVAIYTAREMADAYQISIQQAERYLARFGNAREDLHRLLSSDLRTTQHRKGEIIRTLKEVSYG